MVLILSGPVGAGKSSVAAALAADADGPTACIEGDRFWPFLVKPSPAQSPGDRLKMVMRAVLASARHFDRDDFDVIVDFTIPPWYFAGVSRLLMDASFDLAVLLPAEATCAARTIARDGGTLAGYERFHEFYESFTLTPDRYAIRGEDRSPAETAGFVRAARASGALRYVPVAPPENRAF